MQHPPTPAPTPAPTGPHLLVKLQSFVTLLGGGFEAGLARPQCAHYVYPYLVLVGHHVLPPVSSPVTGS